MSFFESESNRDFEGSLPYWEQRYSSGGNSGVGSYGKFAEFKAEIINSFVEQHRIDSVIEFGCGDGNQLSLANYPHYIGFDISTTVVDSCRERFASDTTKQFMPLDDYRGERAELAISLDVIFHLIEDSTYEAHLRALFGAANRFVIVYSSNTNNNDSREAPHVRHRRFTDWIEDNLPNWSLIERVPNRYPYRGDYREGSFAEFYFFEKKSG